MTSTLGLRPLAALAMVALIGAGCSSGSSAGPGAGVGGGDNTAANRDKAMKFAACMRNNGVRQFPDPDASGALTIDGIVNGSSLDPSTAAWKEAIGACKDLEPAGFMGHKRSAQEQESALKFAACMRENGVTDFPDPTVDGPLIDTTRIPSLAGKDPRSVPGLKAAMQKCRDLAAAAGVARP